MHLTGLSPIPLLVTGDEEGKNVTRVVDCDRSPRLAEIFVVPEETELTMPLEFTVAVALEDELHDTKLVRSALLPSM